MKQCTSMVTFDPTGERRLQQVIRDKEITGNALRLFLVCWHEWKGTGRFGVMPMAEYEEGTGMSSREIRAAFRLLESKDYVLRRKEWRWPWRIFTTEQENRCKKPGGNT